MKVLLCENISLILMMEQFYFLALPRQYLLQKTTGIVGLIGQYICLVARHTITGENQQEISIIDHYTMQTSKEQSQETKKRRDVITSLSIYNIL